MFRSPTCTGGGGSRSDAKEVERMSFSGSVKLLLEFLKDMAAIEEDMRLNILLVRESFLSFFSFLSSFLSSPSWLCTDLDSLMRRPKLLHVLSDDAREGALLGSRECDEEGGGDAGSGLPRVGLLGVMVAFWWSMMSGLWWRSRGVPSVGIASVGFMVRSSRTMRAVTCTDSGFSAPRCTLYTVDLIGADCFFLSGVVEADELKNAGLPRRVLDLPLGEVSTGVVAKNEDLRWARVELFVLKAELARLTCEADSLLVLSASALILCEMPEETLIFVRALVSDFGAGGQPPETLRVLSPGDKRLIPW
jgi:hypothetical protein